MDISPCLVTTEFLDTNVCINNPLWQSSEIIIFLCEYYLVIWDTLRTFLAVLFLLLAVILSELYEKPRSNRNWVTEKKNIEEFVWGTSLFWEHALLAMSFFAAFFLCFLLPKWHTYWMVPIKVHNIAVDSYCFCAMPKIWKSLAI